MKRVRRLSLSLALCCAAVAALLPPAGRAAPQGGDAPRNVTGTVIGVGGRFGGRSWPFRLIIDRYTSEQEVRRLNDALQRGQDELLRELDGMSAGRIQVGNNVGVEANAIIASPYGEGGGTRLTVLYRRTVNFFELRYGARSENYRFGYAELFLGGRSGGQGTFIPAAQVRLRGSNTWEVEDFGVYPARLVGLRARGRSGVR